MKTKSILSTLILSTVFFSIHLKAQTFSFTESDFSFTEFSYGSVEFGDFDNDGDLDLLTFGDAGISEGNIGAIYINTATGFNVDSVIQLPLKMRIGTAKWGDYDADGDLDILVAGRASSKFSTILRNNDGVFEDIDPGFESVDDASIDWGDVDNDGDLDVLSTGHNTNFDRNLKLYINTNGSFDDSGLSLPGVSRGDLKWGDYDADGDLDFLMTGGGDAARISAIYRNDGDLNFVEAYTFKPLMLASGDFGDYDGDGDLDVLLTGSWNNGSFEERRTLVYQNNGANFSEISTPITGVYQGDAIWADLDNDGDLDILEAGNDNTNNITQIWENSGGSFLLAPTILQNLDQSSIDAGDVDGDGDLDLFISGRDTSANSRYAKIWINETNNSNTAPQITNPPSVAIESGAVHITMPTATDAETANESLTFTMQIGTAPGTGDIMPGNVVAGSYKITRPGNIGHANSWVIKNLPLGTYYFDIWAVDNTFNISNKATGSFEISNSPNFTELDINMLNYQDGDLSWGDFDNDGDLDIAVTGFDNSSSTKKSRIVRNDGGGAFSVFSELLGESFGTIEWGDYDQDGDLDILLSGSPAQTVIYRNDGSSFTDISAGLPGFDKGAARWVDYDADGDLDVHLAPLGQIWQNKNSTFVMDTSASETLAGFSEAVASWGDYDNDGDKDVIIAGGNYNSSLYRNDGGIFVDWGFDFDATADGQGFSTNGFKLANSAWADYDNDGDLDFLMNGQGRDSDAGTEAKITVMYKNIGPDLNNEGQWLFEQTEEERNSGSRMYSGTQYGSIAWGDFNNSGNRDFFINGSQGSTINPSDYAALIYKNTGTDTFALDESASATIRGMGRSSSSLADYDNDGDLDILEFGFTGTTGEGLGYVTRLYNSDLAATLPNLPPNSPLNLSSTVSGDTVYLSWDSPGDDLTPSSGLTYNVRIGSATGLDNIVAAHANLSTGKLKKVFMGNAQAATGFKIIGLDQASEYFWSVQAIDGGYAGSAFAPEKSFTPSQTGAGTVTVVNPNGGEILAIGSEYTIDFSSTHESDFKVEYSTNNGGSWTQITTINNTSGNSSTPWTVPNTPSNVCLIKVSDVNNPDIFDVSDDVFTIQELPQLTLSQPNGGEELIIGSEYNIDFSSTYESDFKIEYQTTSGTNWKQITTINNTSGNSSYTWTVPNEPSTECLVRVSDLNTSTLFDVSDAVFSIKAGPLLSLSQPNGGESLVAGEDYNIRWTSTAVANLSISYSNDGAASWVGIANSVPASGNVFIWTIPNTPSTQCLVRIEDQSDNSVFDISDAVFEISAPGSDNDNPHIGKADYSDNEPIKTDHIVTVPITDASPLSSVKLFFKKGGASNYNSVDMSNTSGDIYSGTIPASSLTETGVSFYIFAVDDFFNDSTSDTNSIQLVVPDGINMPGGVKAGNTVSDYRLFSIPLDIDDKPMSQFLNNNSDFGSDVNWESFRLFGLRSGDTDLKEYPDVDNIIPGRAYFLLSSDDKAMNSGLGKTVDISGSYAITVPKGWSLVGNPFNFRVPYDSLYTDPPVNFVLRSFDGDWPLNQSGLEPWKGYALWVESATTFKISPGPDNLGKSPAFYTTGNNSADEWLIQIKAKNGKSMSDFNFVGQQFAASDGIDKLDLRTPPRFQKQVVLSFKNDAGAKIASDVRATNPLGHSWEFTCYTNPDEEVLALNFSGVSTIKEKEVFLYDRDTGLSYNLKQQQEINFAAKGMDQKNFILVAGTQTYLESLSLETQFKPTGFELSPVFPNPFNPVTQLNYSIIREGHVTLEVYNLLGQKISTLVDNNLPEGNYTAVWQPQNASSGIYLFKLTMGKNVQIQRGLLIK